jgi:hypothetical protein
MPGPSYNNPQLEYQRNKILVAKETQRQKTEREKAIVDAANAKKAASLKDEITANNKSINSLTTIIKSAEKTKSEYISSYNTAVRDSLNPSGPSGATQTSGELAVIASWQTLITGREQLINNAKSNIQTLKNKNTESVKTLTEIANSKLKGEVTKVTNKTTTSNSSSGSSSNTRKGEQEIKVKGPYKYNLPLIMPARFSDRGPSPQLSSLGDSYPLLSPPGGVKAELYWGNNKPGRGVLRVNREWLKGILNSSEYKGGSLDTSGELSGRIGNRKPDRSLYGFRFLYNPEKIQMAYDINADLHPGIIATGKDKFLPLTKSSSSVSVNIVLNRMEDMKYRNNPRLAIQNQVYFGKGETTGLIEDIQELHEKGTMYDLEYMFKVLNSPNATFNSQLNGKTADMGFLRPSILELHLGNRLRYPVRVVNLVVEHKIFDPRMVPVFSVVSITFGRFIEFETSNSAAQEVRGPESGGTGGGRISQIR